MGSCRRMISIVTITIYVTFLFALYFATFWLSLLFQKTENEEKELKNYPQVTIAIPAYNEENTIKETIDSVINLDYPKDKFEILVVNDGSIDKTEQIVNKIIKKNKESNIKLISQKNSGKGAALNHAIKHSKGEFFVCLDSDSTIRKDALKKMIPEFEKPDVAIVLPLMKVKNPENLLEKIQWYEYLGNFFYKKLMAKLDCIHVSPGPFSMYRKKVLNELGGFSENNLTEDLEITLRVQKHNYKVIQLFSTEVYTYAPRTFKAFYKQRNRWYKGTIFNLINYKKMIFNPKYGDFGIMHLPSVILSGLLIILVTFILGYNSMKNIFYRFYDLRSINYDIMYFIKKAFENWQILDLSFVNVFLGVVIFIFAFFILFLSVKYAKEKVFKYSILSMLVYILVYGILTFIAWFGVLAELTIGKKQKW